MRVALGADHGGFSLKETIKEYLQAREMEVIDAGTDSEEPVDYPLYGFQVGRMIQKGEADRGIVICGTGLGISMAANKVRGVRAVMCTDPYSARLAREHNNANVLALGGRVTGAGLALEIVDVFLRTEFSGEERHQRRIGQMMTLEEGEE
ncbi:MAG: ribose 5-phosphate isomerase B [Peptococcaceae bacterium]|jgi:ribose 5-phosphate isomerase B|nr:ribose 5-phosphate isomerase B [Peptococcaceae bacterium]